MAFKMRSPFTQQKPGHKKPEGSGTHEGQHTTHGDPETYTKTSKSKKLYLSSVNIDEGNLSTVKVDKEGNKYVVVQDDTATHKAGTKLYINK